MAGMVTSLEDAEFRTGRRHAQADQWPRLSSQATGGLPRSDGLQVRPV